MSDYQSVGFTSPFFPNPNLCTRATWIPVELFVYQFSEKYWEICQVPHVPRPTYESRHICNWPTFIFCRGHCLKPLPGPKPIASSNVVSEETCWRSLLDATQKSVFETQLSPEAITIFEHRVGSAFGDTELFSKFHSIVNIMSDSCGRQHGIAKSSSAWSREDRSEGTL